MAEDIKPIRNFVLFLRTVQEESKIILSDTVKDDGLFDLTVVAVGPGVESDLKQGDTILLAGGGVLHADESRGLYLTKEDNISAVVS